jgi:serine/threonine-protein kinase
VLGTTDYVSPEQAMGQEVDARTDIYSLGVVLFEMVTGDVPFKAETIVGVAMKHVNERLPNVQRRRPEVSSALAAVIERATEKKPEKRYSDMATMLADLERALDVEVARAGRSTGEATTVLNSVERSHRLVTPRRASIAGVLLVLAGVAAALIVAGLAGDDDKAKGGGGGGPPTGEEVALVAAEDFDPLGDSSEHPEEVGNAVDGKTDTFWPTEEYETSPVVLEAANKEGVGLVLEAAKPTEGTQLSINSLEAGWNAAVYAAADGPPTSLEDWGQPVGEISDASEDVAIDLEVAQPSLYYLIWFTKLTGDLGEYKVEIAEASLTGA